MTMDEDKVAGFYSMDLIEFLTQCMVEDHMGKIKPVLIKAENRSSLGELTISIYYEEKGKCNHE